MNPAFQPVTPWAEGFAAYNDYMLPRISRLAPNYCAAAFFVMKLLPARAILDAARAEGKLRPGDEVFESTSGTFGLALALLAPDYGYRLTLVSDPVIDPLLEARFREMGVRLEIVHNKIAGGYQLARLERLRELMANSPRSFFTSQYHNPLNAQSYGVVADHLVAQLGAFDVLVGTVGSGGSMSGTARRLRQLLPEVRIVGVDTHRSVVFGQPNGERRLRGLGNSLIPSNVDHTMFDEIHWVGAGDAYLATRRLHAEHGLYQGGTSGAAHLVADWIARANPNLKVVTLFPDDGTRYQSTIYNDEWLKALPDWTGKLPDAPQTIHMPEENMTSWARMEWARRTLVEVAA